MPNNIAVSITADVADLTAKMGVAQASAKETGRAFRELSAQIAAGDASAETATAQLEAADAFAKSTNAVKLYAREMKSMVPAAEGAHTGMAGITRELLVMGREIGNGNFTKLAGSTTILAGRMGLLTPTVLGTAAAFVAMVAPFAAFIAASEAGANQLARFQSAMDATNGYAGVTISQLQVMARELASFAHTTVGEAMSEMEKLAASGKFTGETMQLIGADAEKMAQMTGESAESFNSQFSKMSDGVAKFALEYNERYHQLTAAQIDYIRQLEEQGRTEQAEHQLAKDIYDYLGHTAPEQLGYLARSWQDVKEAISEAADALMAWGRNTNQDQIDRIDEQLQGLYHDRQMGGNSQADTAQIAALEKQRLAIQATEAAQERTAKAAADSARTQTEGAAAAAKLHEQFEASKTSGEKLQATIRGINEELAKAVKANPGNRVELEKEAAAARAQAEKSDTPRAAKGPKGPSAMSGWEDELRQQEMNANQPMADNTGRELAFWQSKIAATTTGSKEWLAVRAKIYEAEKAQARQAYDQQIAALNDQLDADRGNVAGEQAIWAQKLAITAAAYGEQSGQYKNMLRDQERAEREYASQIAESARKAVAELTKQYETQQRLRTEQNRGTDRKIESGANTSLFGNVSSAVSMAQAHQQEYQQDLAALEAYHASVMQADQQAINAAAALYHGDESLYRNILDQKAADDQAYFDKRAELSARATDQQQADIDRLRGVYNGYVSGTVSTAISGFDGILSRQRSWAQLGMSIYGSLAHAFEQRLGEMVTNWIVEHLLMTGVQRAAAAQQVAATAASNAAQTSLTTAGATQRAAITGKMNMKEITSHAATAAAAAYHAMAGIPIIGPVLGAAAAATTFAAVEAFGTLASFDKGTNILPADMVAQVHAGERIVPAADNSKMISIMERGAAGGDMRGGDSHFHYNPTIPANMPFADQLAAHEGNIIGMFQAARRRGVI